LKWKPQLLISQELGYLSEVQGKEVSAKCEELGKTVNALINSLKDQIAA